MLNSDNIIQNLTTDALKDLQAPVDIEKNQFTMSGFNRHRMKGFQEMFDRQARANKRKSKRRKAK